MLSDEDFARAVVAAADTLRAYRLPITNRSLNVVVQYGLSYFNVRRLRSLPPEKVTSFINTLYNWYPNDKLRRRLKFDLIRNDEYGRDKYIGDHIYD